MTLTKKERKKIWITFLIDNWIDIIFDLDPDHLLSLGGAFFQSGLMRYKIKDENWDFEEMRLGLKKKFDEMKKQKLEERRLQH